MRPIFWLFVFSFIAGCSSDSYDTPAAATPAAATPAAATPAAATPADSKSRTCGLLGTSFTTPCSKKEQLYINTMNYFVERLDALKDLTALKEEFSHTASGSVGMRVEVEKAKVMIFGEIHTNFVAIFDTTAMINAVIEHNQQNQLKTLVLLEGYKPNQALSGENILLQKLYATWENARKESTYNPTRWDLNNAGHVTTYYTTRHHIDATRLVLDQATYMGWDEGATILERNQSLVEVVRQHQREGEFAQILVIAGNLHLPSGEYYHHKKHYFYERRLPGGYEADAIDPLHFHALFTTPSKLRDTLETRAIYTLLKDQPALYLTHTSIYRDRQPRAWERWEMPFIPKS